MSVWRSEHGKDTDRELHVGVLELIDSKLQRRSSVALPPLKILGTCGMLQLKLALIGLQALEKHQLGPLKDKSPQRIHV